MVALVLDLACQLALFYSIYYQMDLLCKDDRQNK